MAENLDPMLYIQMISLLLETLNKIPKAGLSEELRLEVAENTDVAKLAAKAQSRAEKLAAIEAVGKMTDEKPQ